jgi:hypothetical protein
MSWTTPSDLREQVLQVWKRGKILSAGIAGETLFPLKLSSIALQREPGP